MNERQVQEAAREAVRLDPSITDRVVSREGTHLEFKAAFNWGNRAAYCRTMAAFANTDGGFLLFGVTNSPRRLVGLQGQRFDQFDPATLTEFWRAHFDLEATWHITSTLIAGFRVGVIYTERSPSRPVIARANSGDDLKEGAIYYRYRGRNGVAGAAELRDMIDETVERERRTLLQHLRVIAEAGPSNVGILDARRGILTGAERQYLIDATLLKQIKFVREGAFVETGGDPTLRIVGDVQPIVGLTGTKMQPVVVHYEDLCAALLTQRTLSQDEAKDLFTVPFHEQSPYSPIHYMVSAAKWSVDQAVEVATSILTSYPQTKRQLIDRLQGRLAVPTVGAVGKSPEDALLADQTAFDAAYAKARTSKARRTLFLAALRQNPDLLQGHLVGAARVRIAEASTHLTLHDVLDRGSIVLPILHQLFQEVFRNGSANERSTIRKAVARVDDLLWGPQTSG